MTKQKEQKLIIQNINKMLFIVASIIICVFLFCLAGSGNSFSTVLLIVYLSLSVIMILMLFQLEADGGFNGGEAAILLIGALPIIWLISKFDTKNKILKTFALIIFVFFVSLIYTLIGITIFNLFNK